MNRSTHAASSANPSVSSTANTPPPKAILLRGDKGALFQIERVPAFEAVTLTVTDSAHRFRFVVEIDPATAVEFARALRLQAEALTSDLAQRAADRNADIFEGGAQ